MANLSLQAFKKKWADLTGRFKDNSTFDIAEKEYRELSADIADSLFEPVEALRARVEKLEQPAPPAPEGVKWKVYPKVSIEGNNVKVTVSEIEAHGQALPLPTPNAKENVPLPPAGWGTRIDILAATATGWKYIFGEDPWVTPAMVIEDQPEAELLFAAYLFWSNAGGVVEEPVVFVKVVEMDGQEYAPDANGRLILPKGGTTINSTDDILQEGVNNKWWTEARSYLSKATGYVIQGTARAITQSDTLMMILGIFENRLNLLQSGKQNTLAFDNAPTNGSTNPVTSGGLFTALTGKLGTALSQWSFFVGNATGQAAAVKFNGTGERVLSVLATGEPKADKELLQLYIAQAGAVTYNITQLNNTFPSAKVGQRVLTDTLVYERVSVSPSVWISYSVTRLA